MLITDSYTDTARIEELDRSMQAKRNKDQVDRTNAKFKYNDTESYVKGEEEITPKLNINKISKDVLKKGKKAQHMADLRNSSIKWSYN